MKYLHKISYVVLACVATVMLSACAGKAPVYRTYYVDRNCNTFYVDMNGNRVMSGNIQGNRLLGLPVHQDASGRWYFEDALGNRIYQSRYCRG